MNADQKKDLYAVLGVGKDADVKQLKKKYFEIAKKCHPDVNKDDPNAATKFADASEAYEVDPPLIYCHAFFTAHEFVYAECRYYQMRNSVRVTTGMVMPVLIQISNQATHSLVQAVSKTCSLLSLEDRAIRSGAAHTAGSRPRAAIMCVSEVHCLVMFVCVFGGGGVRVYAPVLHLHLHCSLSLSHAVPGSAHGNSIHRGSTWHLAHHECHGGHTLCVV